MKRFEKSGISVVAMAAFLLVLTGCTAPRTPAPAVQPTIPAQTPVDFSETGTILNWDAATEKATDVWSLLYDTPGVPAAKVTLKFEPKSTCTADGKAVACDTEAFKNGDRVTVEGWNIDDTVIVGSLTKSEAAAQMANPASVYCKEQGGTSKIVTAADGSQSGQCEFPDGRACDEWDFFRTKVCQ